ncbi:DUF3558 family protein [Actinopolyspora mortivallis]|uniref:DUF3558 domain-containing protein n=1 Tax=Actinopolyspora mortivallis TaxID=33906 RepID=A0A2T0GZ07_ACTMO|nr:DUF3558 family protein [Actinopolyspora mortivallis]PRW64327.1 hypothetical protein CEP50_05150 [Actinopolyspora mortivallis]
MPHHRLTRILLAAACTTAALAGCATSTPADTNPDTTHTTTSSSEDPFAIPQPLNLAAITNPCHLLTQQQTTTLNAGPPQPNGKSAWGEQQCKWRNQQMTISIAPNTQQSQGLEYTAFTNTEDGKPTHRIEDYPAVYGIGKTDLRCSTSVGVTRKNSFYVSFTVGTEGRGNPEYSDPCAMSDKIAGMVLDNLPPAQ